jgi:hypothetical protein
VHVVSYQSDDCVTFVFGHVVTSGNTIHCGGTYLGSVSDITAILWRVYCHGSEVAVLLWVCGVVWRYRYTGLSSSVHRTVDIGKPDCR